MYRTEKAAYYGEKYDGIFDDIPWEYAEMYEEMDIILHRYCSLQWNHRADLKTYALMYRNVDIDRCSIVDKEIRGYRNTIYSNNASNKEKLVRYYFEYDLLFEMFFVKTIGEKMETLSRKDDITLESYQRIKEKKYDHIPGIIDLSDQTCSVLLSNINQLESAKNDDKYFVNSIKRYDNFVDFIKEIAFPFYFGPHRVHEECFQDYSKAYCNNASLKKIKLKCVEQLIQLHSQVKQFEFSDLFWNYTSPEIEALEQKINDLGDSSQELFRLKNGISYSYINQISFPFTNVILLGESDEERNARLNWEWEIRMK